jgi:hypothetical protein
MFFLPSTVGSRYWSEPGIFVHRSSGQSEKWLNDDAAPP